ncbi:restriction endonuclease subunit M [Candidatus Parcubacteria bacterium]|nr:MAG: restriction endonuclease subunit M [Candidatus Parcubacteria bacterium]
MNQKELRTYLNRFIESLKSEDKELLKARLHGLVSVFPFNEYEYIITFLVDRGVLSFNEYEDLRNDYISANRYLDLFSLAPRVFGQIWGEKHLMDIDERFQKPDKSLDPSYDGEYDLWLDGIRIEVKAARAINTRKRGSLVSKALHWGSKDPFWMNYQQLKLDICDVFVFIGVWVDKILYWVLSNNEVKRNRYLSHQHRGGVEYQIGITHNNISDFNEYLVEAHNIASTVIEKSRLSSP